MTRARPGFFRPTPFIRWSLVPILALFALGMPLMISDWTWKAILGVAFISGISGGFALFLVAPERFQWVGRAVAGAVFLLYVIYFISEIHAAKGFLGFAETRSGASPISALLGLIFIGGPCLYVAMRGMRALDNPEPGWMEFPDPPPPPIKLDVDPRVVEQCIKEFLLTPPLGPDDHRASFVRQYNALPVAYGWDGYLMLRPDGDVGFVDLTIPDGFDRQVWPASEHFIRVRYSKEYPPLASLAPVRPPDAQVCPTCGGSGIVEVANGASDVLVCMCGGIGWIPAAEPTPRR